MKAFLFDVDGVITDAQTKKFTQPELITTLVTLLQNGSRIGFISGRGLLYLRGNVISVFEKYFQHHPGIPIDLLDNIYLSGEFGGVSCIHKNGIREEIINKDLAIPDEVKRGLHFVAFQYADLVLVETEKQTIFTVQAAPAVTNEAFQEQRSTLIDEFKQVIAPYPELEVQSDTHAINIRHKNANKKNATDLFLAWTKEKGAAVDGYYVFGDSVSDLEMGNALQSIGLPFTFVFVGKKEDLASSTQQFPITVTDARESEGTLAFLKAQIT